MNDHLDTRATGSASTEDRAVAEAVFALMGKTLNGSSRVVDMERFFFGTVTEALNRHGQAYSRNEFDLHVQCPWRIVGAGRVVVGYRDMREPPGGVSDVDFDPNEAPTNRRDELLQQFHDERADRARVVTACVTTSFGDVRLTFDDGSVLEILPDSTGHDCEYWRLLGPDDEHWVMTGSGVEVLRSRPNLR